MKKYPAQIRYEKSHPVVSFRLTRELKKRLENVLEGKSFADFVKEGLGVREREKKSLTKAHNEGFRSGFGYAKIEFGVYFRCAVCGMRMYVRGPKFKKAVRRYIEEHRWGHKECLEKGEMERR